MLFEEDLTDEEVKEATKNYLGLIEHLTENMKSISIFIPTDEEVLNFLRNYLWFKVTNEEMRTGKNTYVPENHKFCPVPYEDFYDYRAKTKKEWDEILESEDMPYVLKITRSCQKNDERDLTVTCIPMYPEERDRSRSYNLLWTCSKKENYSGYYVNISNPNATKAIPACYAINTMFIIWEKKYKFKIESI